MKKRLTETQFQEAIKDLKIGDQTIKIARGVLADGEPQANYVKTFGLSKGAVSQAVNRVWNTAQENAPNGFEKITAVLPSHQAFIVKKWAKRVKQKKEKKE